MIKQFLIKLVKIAIRELNEDFNKMAATLQDLNNALATLGTDLTNLQAAIDQLDKDVEAKLNPDFTAQVTQVQSLQAQVQAALAAVQSEDAKVNPPAPPAA